MPEAYDLTKLDSNSFEHMVNLLALRVLGAGHTGFGPGSDGGRDGYFEGEAPYPSDTDRWAGRWYLQSKFHKPHLSKDPQKWLVEQIQAELNEFAKGDSKRIWPDNWLVASNIDPSGVPMTGAFDAAKKLVAAARPQLETRFHIWGGSKVLNLLTLHPEVAEYYALFLTPGHVLPAIYNNLKDERAEIDTILRHLIVRQFGEQQYTKLEQAGSDADTRPGIHRLFIDLPFRASEYELQGLATEFLVRAGARNHRIDPKQPDTKEWKLWQRHPSRARVWFVRGGPGQGKSTIGQYFCQVQRAALILQDEGPIVVPAMRSLAEEIRESSQRAGFWPLSPRIPITIELKEYAQWFGQRAAHSARGILTFLAERISAGVEQEVLVGTIKRALQTGGWFAIFDGLDEVPHDVKDKVASEVCYFVDDIVIEKQCDLLSLCTSRPQGYSGQFSTMEGPTIDLVNLSPERALICAKPVIELGRTEAEAKKSIQILEAAIQSRSVKELMITPLQSHIMAVVIRDGGRPPDRRWQLFTNFYQVIRRREANRNLADPKLAQLLREDEQLLKTVHNRLGFVLQARAETSRGAQTSLDRREFEALVRNAVELMKDTNVNSTVEVLMDATTNRLVLVSTPDDGNSVRFDIRPLQEFFAAEFLYESVDAEELRKRMETLAGDSHWREVIHFLLSALIEDNRKTELAVAVSVLEQLNEGNGSPQTRLLNRRLARGSLLAARLLQEGVLEQDKRVRQQFRNAIEPLTGLTDRHEVGILTQVSQPTSRPWLINFLTEVLHESNWTESVGAAITLVEILNDDDASVTEVQRLLLASPPSYITTVLKAQARDFLVEEKAARKGWMLETVLCLLLRAEWRTFSAKELSTLIRILPTKDDILRGVAERAGLSDYETCLLRELKDSETGEPRTADVDCGFVKGHFFSVDWISRGSERPQPDMQGRPPRGILEIVYRVLQFSSARSREALHAMLNSIEPDYGLLEALPSRLLAQLPLDGMADISKQCMELSALTEEQFSTLLETHQLGARTLRRPLRMVLGGVTPFSDLDWKCLLEHFPQLGPVFWSEFCWRGLVAPDRPDTLDTAQSVNLLIDTLTQCPKILAEMPHLWGRLFAKSPDREEELRRALQHLSIVPAAVISWPMGYKFYTFSLSLPAEAHLLPHLLAHLCAWSEDDPGGVRFAADMARANEHSVSQKIKAFVGDDNSILLSSTLSDQNTCVRSCG